MLERSMFSIASKEIRLAKVGMIRNIVRSEGYRIEASYGAKHGC